MEHIIIFSYIVSLIIGAYAAFYSNQLYRIYRYSFLKILVIFIIFFNLMLLINLTSTYIFTNLINNDPSNIPPMFIIIGHPLSFLIIVVMIYSFIRTIMELQDVSISVRFKRWFAAGVIIFSFSYAIGFTTYLESTSSRWLIITNLMIGALC